MDDIQEIRRKRFAAWMEARKLSQTDVADKSGKTRSYISLILSNGKSFGERTARALEESLGMARSYLDGENEDGLSPILIWESPDDLPRGQYALIPRVSIRLSAGNGIVAEEETDAPPLAFTEEWIRSRNVSSRKNLRICKVSGDSMSPFLEEGDSVMIDMGQRSILEGKVYCLRYGSELRIKRLFKRFDGGLRIVSDNKEYPEESIDPTNTHVEVLGRQIWRAG
jgi:phage repressor protein C with HTH and peptisase S24 domain